jgi:iron complex outermembrane receptor protein/outer membrane receptor for ferrienterochelin and colicins
MQKILALLAVMLCIGNVAAQNKVRFFIKDKASKFPLSDVNIQCKNIFATTNENGLAVFDNLSDGWQVFTFSMKGYTTLTDSFSLPILPTDSIEVLMEIENDILDEVIIQSTRTSRSINNTPTRVETIDGEELDEKNNMRPANVSMLLHESTGLQVQQTSATSGNASIRVQGLDGRYTQLLKNSYPNFGNFASGLSILEIPPLDLKQVEVIKGPASTLYGGGAIAGVVNFISKYPKKKFEGDFILNQSSIGQTNIGGYVSGKKGKVGYSFLGLINFQKAFDVDKDNFSEIPKSKNFTIDPRLFFEINPSTTLMLGNSFTKNTNTGGDMDVINNKPDANHVYFEKNNSARNTTTLELNKKFNNKANLILKQSVATYEREISIPNYSFSGNNVNSFTELSVVINKNKHTFNAGLNLVFDKFKQRQTNIQNNQSFTIGGYFQDTWDVSDQLKIESGLRIDQVNYQNNNYNKNQTFVLPRIYGLYKFSNKLSSRIGGGLGYKIPTIFTEQAERLQYQDILPLSDVTAERSVGGTADLNYKTNLFNGLSFSINQMFFYTSISNSLVLNENNSGEKYFYNANSPVISKGFETNLKFIYHEDLKFFVGYTFTDARATYLTGNQFLPLLSKNKLNLTLMYEKEDNFKLGLEGYFTDKQYLFNGIQTPNFWEFGFMAQKTFNKISLFINFENFTDQRQSKYKAVVNPPFTNPTFDDIWNHTEGFVINGGIKLKF